jgi:hypothetical protein
MTLNYAGVVLKNEDAVLSTVIKTNSALIEVSKCDLSLVPGLLISYQPCIISMDDSQDEARAQMPCGHVISRESMTQFLRSLIENRKYKILCPGLRPDGKPCRTEWPFPTCRKVGVLTTEEANEFEVGLSKNAVVEFYGGGECPFCRSFVIRP